MARPSRRGTLMSGVTLIAIGSLVLVPGLGAGAFAAAAWADLLDQHNVADAKFVIGTALVLGGPFLVIGTLLAWAGIKALRDE